MLRYSPRYFHDCSTLAFVSPPNSRTTLLHLALQQLFIRGTKGGRGQPIAEEPEEDLTAQTGTDDDKEEVAPKAE